MAAIQEMLERLPSRSRPETRKQGARGTPRPAKMGPEIVVNDVNVTMVFTAPFAFALPQRLVDWLLERFKVGEMKVSVSSSRRPIGAPKPPARRATTRKAAPGAPRKPVRKAA